MQFGHDAMPFGRLRRSSGFTSAMTSGTSGSMRNAADLSMTFAPGGRGLRRPLERRAGRRRRRSRGRDRRSSRAQHLARRPRRRRTAACGPRSAATRTRAARDTGNARSSRMRSISVPTRPVAPIRPDAARLRLTPFAPSSPNAVCSARTARSTSSSATTHEIRIVDVLIISMLTPSVASISNILRGDAGVRLHARADERDPADVRVGAIAARLGVDDDLLHAPRGARRGRRAAR